jgi:hypothetical protein
VVQPNETAHQVADKTTLHGSVIFPKLMADDKANALRDYILERNSI